MPLHSSSIPQRLLDDKGDLPCLLDEADTGSVDCRSCIASGNKVWTHSGWVKNSTLQLRYYAIHLQVSLSIKSPLGISYMYVNNNEHIVVRHKIPDPDSSQGIDVSYWAYAGACLLSFTTGNSWIITESHQTIKKGHTYIDSQINYLSSSVHVIPTKIKNLPYNSKLSWCLEPK